MKKQIFGLRKAPVNKLIKQMEWDFFSQTNHLEQEIRNLVNENEQLQSEIDEILEERTKVDEDFWNFANERIKIVIKQLSKHKELEMMAIRKEYQDRIEVLDQQIRKIHSEMDSTELSFSELLTNIDHLIERTEETIQKEDVIDYRNIDDNPELKEMNSNNNWKLDDESEQLNDVISSKMKSEEQELSGISNLSGNNEEADYKFDNFWGKIEELGNKRLESNSDVHLYNAETDEINILTEVDIQENYELPTPSTSLVNEDIKQIGSIVNKDNQINKDSDSKDEALLEQINEIKSQYIVGKFAGEDLYDSKGSLIISRFGLITREVVEEANNAGKLAELIVNMKLTGVGED